MNYKNFLLTTFMIITAFWCGYFLSEIKYKQEISNIKKEIYRVKISETSTKIKIESKTPRTLIEYSGNSWTLVEIKK